MDEPKSEVRGTVWNRNLKRKIYKNYNQRTIELEMDNCF